MARMDEFLFSEDAAKGGGGAAERSDPPVDNWKLLIVDDEQDVHDVTMMALKRLTFDAKGVEFLSAFSASEAKGLLVEHPEIAVILLDVVMEEDDSGLALVRHIREELHNSMVRIIVRTGHPGEAPEESVTVAYDINDYKEKTELTSRGLRTALINALRSYRDIATIHDLNRELEATQSELIYALGEIAESRSVETGHHVKRVGEIAALLAVRLGLPERQAALLRLAASMHDLGKLAIHDSILKKPGPLTPAEYEMMKTHSALGYEILKHSRRPLIQMAAVIAREHHENYDGSGYPDGLSGEEINIYSRITALADVFDALGMRRAYKAAWPLERILEYIRKERGKKFDPQLVDLFFRHIDEIERVRQLFSDPEQDPAAAPN